MTCLHIGMLIVFFFHCHQYDLLINAGPSKSKCVKQKIISSLPRPFSYKNILPVHKLYGDNPRKKRKCHHYILHGLCF